MKHKPHLLIVDDEVELAEALRDQVLLDHPDWDVAVVHDGRSAYQKTQETEFDAILSDFNMPGMTGVTLLRAIREAGSDCPFIFLTGYADSQLLLQALKLGAFDLLEKGLGQGRMNAVLEEAVTYSAGLRELGKSESSIEGSRDRRSAIDLKEARRQIVLLRLNNNKRGSP